MIQLIKKILIGIIHEDEESIVVCMVWVCVVWQEFVCWLVLVIINDMMICGLVCVLG